jgi:hypothetical protein
MRTYRTGAVVFWLSLVSGCLPDALTGLDARANSRDPFVNSGRTAALVAVMAIVAKL